MFNPKKSFFELPVVRWAIGIHVAIASASALAILITGDYGFSPTADGFNRFLTDFKLPIGFLAMLIPVMALLATNHRSEQTREQIRVAESQNVFANYYKHMEEFERYYKFDPETQCSIDARYIYSKVFSGSHRGDYSCDEQNIDDLRVKIHEFSRMYDVFSVRRGIAEIEGLVKEANEIKAFCKSLFGVVSVGGARPSDVPIELHSFRSYYYDIVNLSYVFNMVIVAYSFDPHFSKNDVDKLFLSIFDHFADEMVAAQEECVEQAREDSEFFIP